MTISVASTSATARRASTGMPLTSATLPREADTISTANGGFSGIDGSMPDSMRNEPSTS